MWLPFRFASDANTRCTPERGTLVTDRRILHLTS
jgi:hypothetical protein